MALSPQRSGTAAISPTAAASGSSVAPQAVVFVGNISCQAEVAYLQRLFSAYGHVMDVRIDENKAFALISYQSVDDADSSIAALHMRYCMSPKVPIIVLYSKDSPRVSQYGHLVSEEYRSAAREKREVKPLPLIQFDARFERGPVQLPPSDIVPPPAPPTAAWRGGPVLPSAVAGGAFPHGLFP